MGSQSVSPSVSSGLSSNGSILVETNADSFNSRRLDCRLGVKRMYPSSFLSFPFHWVPVLYASILIDSSNWVLQILLRFQYDLHWSRNDLLLSCELVFTLWRCALLGINVAIDAP